MLVFSNNSAAKLDLPGFSSLGSSSIGSVMKSRLAGLFD
jgi:hypothetical protein